MKDQKSKCFKIDYDTATSLIGVADLLNIDKNDLLSTIAEAYVITVRKAISEKAATYPTFIDKYPFIK